MHKIDDRLYLNLPGLILGFHGCTKEVYDRVLYNSVPLKKSNNDYDWLGHGIYFWENSYQRAYDWATEHCKSSNKEPAVVGAVIDLGHCLNLTDYGAVDYLRIGYEVLKASCEQSNIELPKNGNFRRDLDCAVIGAIHESMNNQYDSVRGLFIEGDPVYTGSGFRDKTHVQICVVNPNCIKGYFDPLNPTSNFRIP